MNLYTHLPLSHPLTQTQRDTEPIFRGVGVGGGGGGGGGGGVHLKVKTALLMSLQAMYLGDSSASA